MSRQGNPRILEHLRSVVGRRGLQHTVVLLSEVRVSSLKVVAVSLQSSSPSVGFVTAATLTNCRSSAQQGDPC